MRLNEWITKNYDMLITTTKGIVKNDDEADDVFQSVIEQLIKLTPKLDEMPDKEKKYFFIRVLKNNYHSTTSRYYTEHKRGVKNNVSWNESYEDIPDTPYVEEIPDMDWVKRQLDTMDWFSRDLFLLWLEMKTFISVSNTTTIPVNSVARYIKQIKEILKEKWESKN